ncbi:MAG: Serine/threonine phosphatase stp [Pelotomaculum sp. PtaU1.Bin035]|nr:MAG: Serine/threonine phosphatase stp [Pelotomaculum sp. PtaU1.Bin035]
MLDDGQSIKALEQKEISKALKPWENTIIKNFLPVVAENGVFAVSDGMGGHNAGEEASRLAVEQLFSMKKYIFQTPAPEGITSRFQDYVVKANTFINTKAGKNNELKGMGATLTGILLCEAGVLTFNLGDSRTYAFSAQGLTRLTRDHTEGQRLLDFGTIKPEELHLMENAKAITRYLGVDDKYLIPQADIEGPIPVEKKIWLLLCSDGLTDMLSDEEISIILFEHFSVGKQENAARLLVEKALEDKPGQRGGIDNITVLLVEADRHIPTILEHIKEFFKN